MRLCFLNWIPSGMKRGPHKTHALQISHNVLLYVILSWGWPASNAYRVQPGLEETQPGLEVIQPELGGSSRGGGFNSCLASHSIFFSNVGTLLIIEVIDTHDKTSIWYICMCYRESKIYDDLAICRKSSFHSKNKAMLGVACVHVQKHVSIHLSFADILFTPVKVLFRASTFSKSSEKVRAHVYFLRRFFGWIRV